MPIITTMLCRLAPRSALLRRVGLVRVAALFNEPLTQDLGESDW
jgi:hypothetical protein